MNIPLRYRSTLAAGFAVGMMIVFLMLGCPRIAFSATNIATDPGGGGVSLNPSGIITVNSVPLELVKQARNLAGTVLASGATVTSGDTIYFVLSVDNSTAVPAGDIQITDQLDEGEFTYVPNSIETTTVPTGSPPAVIWAGPWLPLLDTVGLPDDIASITNTGPPAGLDRLTVGAVAGQTNQPLDVSSNTLRAIRFRVTVN